MVLSFSAVYMAIGTVTWFRVFEALLEIMKQIIGKIVRFLDSSDNGAHNLMTVWIARNLYSQVRVHSGSQIQYSEYDLYACMHTQLASPAESGITIILGSLCISPTKAIHQRGRPYMQHSKLVHLTWFLAAYVGLAVTYHTAVSDLLSIVLLLSNLQFWKNPGIS